MSRTRWMLMLAAAALPAVAMAAERPMIGVAAENADESSDTGPGNGVFVHDSAIVGERVALAERMERSGEWSTAADILQEVIEKYGQRIVATKESAESDIRRYIGATDLVQRRLAKWPPEGLAAYNARFGFVAQGMLNASPADPAVLSQVESDYFVTDAGRDAGIRRIDRALEAGEFGLAAWTADRLLELHPNLGDQHPAILFRAGLAHHLADQDAQAKKSLDELKNKFPKATAVLGGQTVVLATALGDSLAEAPPAAAQVAGDSWPTFGGDRSRGRVPHTVGRPGARLAGTELSEANMRGLPREQQTIMRRQRPEPGVSGVMPVADRGQLFFQDGQRIFAVNLDSNMPLAGWANTYPGSQAGRFTLPGKIPAGDIRSRQTTLTITDDSVLAVMGQNDLRVVQMTGETTPTRLVCLDRATGRQKWIATAESLPDEAQRSMILSGCPLVVGNNVYVTGRSSKQANFEDCYVVCFSLTDGKPKWSCYVSGASLFTNMAGMGWGGMPGSTDNESHLAFSGGRLFVSTNLGAVAAIDAYSGNVIWLTTYPRSDDDAVLRNPRMQVRFGGRPAPRTTLPWAYNPPIVRDGSIFALPTDGGDVLILDAGTGALKQRVLSKDIEGLDTLVGLTNDGQLIVAGDIEYQGSATATVLRVDWRKYNAATFKRGSTSEPSITLRRPLVSTGSSKTDDGVSPDAMRGRPFLTDQYVYIPTVVRLYCIDLKTRGLNDAGTYPRYPTAWDPKDADGEAPGNVLLVGDHVVLAGASRVDVYTDLTVARAKLDARQSAAPSDPVPRLEYAEMMFAAGDIPVSLAKLDEAVELMGGASALHNGKEGKDRQRLFIDALNFATKLTSSTAQEPRITQQASAFFDKAALAAATPEQQVQWRMARAKLFVRMSDFNNETRVLQEIIADRSLRVVPSLDEKAGSATAGAVAEKAIAQLISTVGRQCYVSYDLVAGEKFTAAGNDPAQLLEVARMYPNSTVAPRCLIAAADAYETAGDHRLACDVFRQAMRLGSTPAQRDMIVAGMARNYLAIPGGIDSAIARLSGALRPNEDPPIPRPMKLPDGTALSGKTFMAVLNELRRLDAPAVATALPDFRLPGREMVDDPKTGKRHYKGPFLPATADDTIPDVAALVVPDATMARNDRVIAWTGKSLAVYAVGANKPLAEYEQINQAPKGAGWVGDKLVVWSGDAIWVCGPQNGAVMGSVKMSSLAVLPPLPDSDDQADDEQMANGPMRQRQMMIINAPNGPGFGDNQPEAEPRNISLDPEQIINVVPTAKRIVALTTKGRLLGLDASNAEIVWQVRLTDGNADRVIATDEFAVARGNRGSTSTLLILDAFSGRLLARPRFSAGNGTALVNFAVSREGMLVYTMPDRLATKDLFEPWEGKPPNERVADAGPGVATFTGAVRPDQLVVNQGLVAALSGGGMVRIYSLLTQNEHFQQLATGGGEWDASLRLIGSQLYTVAPQSFRTFDLIHPAPPETQIPGLTDPSRPPFVRAALFGQHHVILLDSMNQNGSDDSPAYRLWAFNRDRINGVESGRIDHQKIISDPSGIKTWQAVDGGLYYQSGDNKLHFLRGAADDKKS